MLAGEFEGSAKNSATIEKQYAFAPDEVSVGSIVFGRLKRAMPNYHKTKDDCRPMLVTGLWRGVEGSVEKLELMSFTTRVSQKQYPDDLVVDLEQVVQRGKSSTFLPTHQLYILDNDAHIFPFENNQETIKMDGALWEDILVCRAQAIVYSNSCLTCILGAPLDGLTREGFIFPTIPHYAIRSGTMLPEVDYREFNHIASDIVPQGLVDEIVSFAVRYTERMHHAYEQKEFSFPPFIDWPINLPPKDFPDWRRIDNRAPLTPELA